MTARQHVLDEESISGFREAARNPIADLRPVGRRVPTGDAATHYSFAGSRAVQTM